MTDRTHWWERALAFASRKLGGVEPDHATHQKELRPRFRTYRSPRERHTAESHSSSIPIIGATPEQDGFSSRS